MVKPQLVPEHPGWPEGSARYIGLRPQKPVWKDRQEVEMSVVCPDFARKMVCHL
jgi:hypothetical protein